MTLAWMRETWNNLSKMEKTHIHRNIGVIYIFFIIYIHAIFIGYVCYTNADLVKVIPAPVFYIYCALSVGLPISAMIQFRRFLKDKTLRAGRGNSLDTVYSNFFIQFQLLSIAWRTMESYPTVLRNPLVDFTLGIVIPQLVYRRFRPTHRAGARDVTNEAYNEQELNKERERLTPEQLAKIARWKEASGKFQSIGFCYLKWMLIGFNLVLTFCRTYAGTPRAMLSFMGEICIVYSLYQAIYPFLYTMRFRKVIRTEYLYWKIWYYMDRTTQFLLIFVGMSFIIKNFHYGDYTQFPLALFVAYGAYVLAGVAVNLRLPRFQDYFMVATFAGAALLGRFPLK